MVILSSSLHDFYQPYNPNVNVLFFYHWKDDEVSNSKSITLIIKNVNNQKLN